MNEETLLLLYSEWLDADQGIITAEDDRTHEDLVREFLEEHPHFADERLLV